MSARIAILITYYNEAELLTECLNSLLGGECQPDEVLIYDDASTTPPGPFIPAAAKVRVIRAETNRGPGTGRNELMALSTCDYVHIQDADDLFAPDWCTKVRQAIEASEPDVIFTEVSLFDEQGVRSSQAMSYELFSSVSRLRTFAIEGVLVAPSTTFKRKLGLAIGGYRPRDVLKLAEDYDFHVRLTQAVSSYAVLSDALICVRWRAASNSRDTSADVVPAAWVSLLKAISLLAQELSPQYRPLLAEQAAYYSSLLYRMGNRDEARQGFTTARSIGKPMYLHRGQFYRLIARIVGPMSAEILSTPYIAFVPEPLRRKMRTLTRS